MRYLFVDAETDGLYGRFLSVAALVCDEQGEELEQFSCRWDFTEADIESPWVRENVLPLLADEQILPTEEDMLEAFWRFYKKQGEVLCIGDVIYPVECRLFEKCVRLDQEARAFEGPYPLLDLSSMLYARGIDPLKDRLELAGTDGLARHNALDDVRMSHAIWKKYVCPGL